MPRRPPSSLPPPPLTRRTPHLTESKPTIRGWGGGGKEAGGGAATAAVAIDQPPPPPPTSLPPSQQKQPAGASSPPLPPPEPQQQSQQRRGSPPAEARRPHPLPPATAQPCTAYMRRAPQRAARWTGASNAKAIRADGRVAGGRRGRGGRPNATEGKKTNRHGVTGGSERGCHDVTPWLPPRPVTPQKSGGWKRWWRLVTHPRTGTIGLTISEANPPATGEQDRGTTNEAGRTSAKETAIDPVSD